MDSLPMSNRVRYELLREWRLAKNMDMGVLARKAILSKGQILQLESGETSLFYTQAIQEKAARKVALLLGGDPDLVVRTDEPSDDNGEASGKLSVMDALIELQQRQGHTDAGGSRSSRTGWGLLALFLMGGVGVMGVAAQFNAANPRPGFVTTDNANASGPSTPAQTEVQAQMPKVSAGTVPQQLSPGLKPESTPTPPKVLVQFAPPVEKPVVLPEVSWFSTDLPNEVQANNR
jgi:transcriptional regulator with XRE-family HTH domain